MTSSAQQKSAATKKHFANRATTANATQHRVNFLSQAMLRCVSLRSPAAIELARQFAGDMRQIGKKGQVKLHPHLKRMSCKRCHSVLVGDRAVRIRLKSKKTTGRAIVTCLRCKRFKRYATPKQQHQRLLKIEKIEMKSEDSM